MNFMVIYNELFEGKTLEFEFDTTEEKKEFQVAFSKFKAKQDKMLLELGMTSENKTRRVQYSRHFPADVSKDWLFIYRVRFVERQDGVEYKFKVVEQEPVPPKEKVGE